VADDNDNESGVGSGYDPTGGTVMQRPDSPAVVAYNSQDTSATFVPPQIWQGDPELYRPWKLKPGHKHSAVVQGRRVEFSGDEGHFVNLTPPQAKAFQDKFDYVDDDEVEDIRRNRRAGGSVPVQARRGPPPSIDDPEDTEGRLNIPRSGNDAAAAGRDWAAGLEPVRTDDTPETTNVPGVSPSANTDANQADTKVEPDADIIPPEVVDDGAPKG
jgi:hypothetical protein